MKMVLATLAVIFAAITGMAAETFVKVTADRVNLRARPDIGSEIVGQASEDQILRVKSDTDAEWFEVEPPSNVDVWVYAELVRDNKASTKIKVRSGPGISFRDVGDVPEGRELKVRKDEGGWLAIDPPLECSVWISRKYTRVVSNSEKTETVLEPEKTQPSPPPVKKREITLPVPVVKKTNGLPSGVNKPPMPDNDEPFPGTNPDIEATVIRSNSEKNGQEIPWDLKDKKLVASMPQGRMVFYRNSAVLKTGFMWRKPSEYRLVQYDGRDHAVTRCYLTGHDSQLKALEGKRIDIYVREYWVQGVKLPVAVPDLVSKKL